MSQMEGGFFLALQDPEHLPLVLGLLAPAQMQLCQQETVTGSQLVGAAQRLKYLDCLVNAAGAQCEDRRFEPQIFNIVWFLLVRF